MYDKCITSQVCKEDLFNTVYMCFQKLHVFHQNFLMKLSSLGREKKKKVMTWINLVKTQETGKDRCSVCMVQPRET